MVAVIVAVPRLTAVIVPYSLTVATEGSEVAHTTLLYVASEGVTVAVACVDSPTRISGESAVTVISVTGTGRISVLTSESGVVKFTPSSELSLIFSMFTTDPAMFSPVNPSVNTVPSLPVNGLLLSEKIISL